MIPQRFVSLNAQDQRPHIGFPKHNIQPGLANKQISRSIHSQYNQIRNCSQPAVKKVLKGNEPESIDMRKQNAVTNSYFFRKNESENAYSDSHKGFKNSSYMYKINQASSDLKPAFVQHDTSFNTNFDTSTKLKMNDFQKFN